MKITFLSSLDPDDIHNWSGILYYIYHSLKRDNEVMWIGKDVLDEVKEYHYTYIEDRPFIPEYYAAFLCKLLTQKLKNEYYDIIICRDYFLCAYLVTDRPLIYIGDTNFQLFKDYLNIKDKEYENLCDVNSTNKCNSIVGLR